jgi:fused signal recognition particle receptor
MDELRKVKRVMSKIDPDAPHETLLVIDAAMGQNAIAQARVFHEAVSVDGLILTKLDGTARGGVVFAIAHQLGLPLRLIGIGEGIDDLRDFEAGDFVKALIDG